MSAQVSGERSDAAKVARCWRTLDKRSPGKEDEYTIRAGCREQSNRWGGPCHH
jgi:hypothetical protein